MLHPLPSPYSPFPLRVQVLPGELSLYRGCVTTDRELLRGHRDCKGGGRRRGYTGHLPGYCWYYPLYLYIPYPLLDAPTPPSLPLYLGSVRGPHRSEEMYLMTEYRAGTRECTRRTVLGQGYGP